MKERFSGLLKNKYALIVLAAGLVLLLLPWGSGTSKTSEQTPEVQAEEAGFSIEEQETRLSEQLSRISGAGEASVLLSVEGGVYRELAQSGEDTLVLDSDSGEKIVETYYINPKYTGAVIVCPGAGSSSVRLEIMRAVQAFTALGTDKIVVLVGKQT
ncbi:MAG: stage III sporulation protein AG [Oscillospiraceae bacterium]|nr:stage III sporulation protein AG [Oscillospiraceae bacterium]